MLWFSILAMLLILVAITILLPTLLRKSDDNATDANVESERERRQQNIQIAREQLAELEREYAKGAMDEATYQAAKTEREANLYTDLEEQQDSNKKAAPASLGNKFALAAIAVFLPVFSAGFYLILGSPESLEAKVVQQQQELPENMDVLVEKLRAKLEAEPNNAEGWFMLGRSYMALGQIDEAVYAYGRLLEQQPDAASMVMLADTLAIQDDGRIRGRSAELIETALQQEPQNRTALWLGGLAASQTGNNGLAIQRWQTLVPLISNEPESVQQVQQLIARAQAEMAASANAPTAVIPAPVSEQAPVQTPTPSASVVPEPTIVAKTEPAPTASPVAPVTAPVQNNDAATATTIKVTVSLATSLAAQANPEDTVFIYAKAVQGPPMPLAVVRVQVKDLPVEVSLDDSQAMMPAMKLSMFPQVKIGARVSKSGNAISENGDLIVEQQPFKLGDRVTLEINQVVSK